MEFTYLGEGVVEADYGEQKMSGTGEDDLLKAVTEVPVLPHGEIVDTPATQHVPLPSHTTVITTPNGDTYRGLLHLVHLCFYVLSWRRRKCDMGAVIESMR